MSSESVVTDTLSDLCCMQSSKGSSRSSKKLLHSSSSRGSPAKPKQGGRGHTHASKNSSSQQHLTVNISRDLIDTGDSDTASNASGRRSRRKRKGASAKAALPPTKRTHLSAVKTRSSPRASPRRKERVFIPGERTSPRKRKGRGTAGGDAEKILGAESGGEEAIEGVAGEEVEEESVELDDDTFKKVRKSGTEQTKVLMSLRVLQCKTILKPQKKAMEELGQSSDPSPEVQ